MTDPIVEEVRRVRAEIAARNGNDLRRIFEDARSREGSQGRAVVSVRAGGARGAAMCRRRGTAEVASGGWESLPSGSGFLALAHPFKDGRFHFRKLIRAERPQLANRRAVGYVAMLCATNAPCLRNGTSCERSRSLQRGHGPQKGC
jgi:hypothetical protein